jgi:hypothetical protein
MLSVNAGSAALELVEVFAVFSGQTLGRTTVGVCFGTRGVFVRRVVRARNLGVVAFFRRITFGVLLVLFIFYLSKSVM